MMMMFTGGIMYLHNGHISVASDGEGIIMMIIMIMRMMIVMVVMMMMIFA
jgi:hypothetical protein